MTIIAVLDMVFCLVNGLIGNPAQSYEKTDQLFMAYYVNPLFGLMNGIFGLLLFVQIPVVVQIVNLGVFVDLGF